MPMTQVDPTQVKVDASRGSGGIADFFRRHVLYIFILTFAILGVAYTNISHLLGIVSCFDGGGLRVDGMG